MIVATRIQHSVASSFLTPGLCLGVHCVGFLRPTVIQILYQSESFKKVAMGLSAEGVYTWSTRLLCRVNPYQAPYTVKSPLVTSELQMIVANFISLPEGFIVAENPHLGCQHQNSGEHGVA
jgi:hypothetical protein